MTNREPSTPLLRWADVRAWLPNITRWQIRQWEDAGLLHRVQRKKGSKRRHRGSGAYWRKRELKDLVGE